MILEQIRQLREAGNFNREELDAVVDKMEEILGAAEMWRTIRPAMSYDELLENAEFIARDNDM